MEDIMLRARLAEGLPLTVLTAPAFRHSERAVASHLADPSAFADGRLVLTRQGRLLADAVIRDLTLCDECRADPGRDLVGHFHPCSGAVTKSMSSSTRPSSSGSRSP